MPRGGARPGAGRPARTPPVDLGAPTTPIEFFKRLMSDDSADPALRLKAAEAVERIEREERLRRNPLGIIGFE